MRFLLCFALLGPFVAEVEWRFCVQFLVVPRGGSQFVVFRGFDFWYFWLFLARIFLTHFIMHVKIDFFFILAPTWPPNPSQNGAKLDLKSIQVGA